MVRVPVLSRGKLILINTEFKWDNVTTRVYRQDETKELLRKSGYYSNGHKINHPGDWSQTDTFVSVNKNNPSVGLSYNFLDKQNMEVTQASIDELPSLTDEKIMRYYVNILRSFTIVANNPLLLDFSFRDLFIEDIVERLMGLLKNGKSFDSKSNIVKEIIGVLNTIRMTGVSETFDINELTARLERMKEISGESEFIEAYMKANKIATMGEFNIELMDNLIYIARKTGMLEADTLLYTADKVIKR